MMNVFIRKNPPAKVGYFGACSPVGKLVVGTNEQGQICRIAFQDKRNVKDIIAEWKCEWQQTMFFRIQGRHNNLLQDIAVVGTVFQHHVWREMVKIPYGQTVSYGDLAARIGRPSAARAVGAACGANPVPYLIPCHRVLAAKGALGGFSGGLDKKMRLLKAEGIVP